MHALHEAGKGRGCDIVVANLTRFGDLLQSQPLFEDLHDSGFRVGLLCLENFAPALPLLRHVDAAWSLPGASLMALLDKDWREAASRLFSLADGIRREGAPRCVINLTATLSARLLAKLIAPSHEAILGFGVDGEGFGVNRGIWSTFLCGTTLCRQNAPFNIADMFRMVAAPLLPPEIINRPGVFTLASPEGEALEHAGRLLEAPARLPGARRPSGYIAMQLGASAERRQWPAAHFAALGDMLWEKAELCPVLLGAPAEHELGNAYAKLAGGPYVNAIGKTDIPQLAALLTQCRLLVTNDTGTMHLAAGLGLPCLAFFLATAQPWDTGPYIENSLCLEPALACHPCPFGQACPHDGICREQIAPEAVLGPILSHLSGAGWEHGVGSDLRRQARIWLTGGTDKGGFAEIKSISGHEREDRTLWLRRQRRFWRHILDDLDDRPSRTMESASLPGCSPAFLEQVLPVLSQAARVFGMLGEQGRIIDKSPMAGQLFLRNCERAQTLLDGCPQLRSLGYFWRSLRMELGGRMEDLLRLVDTLTAHLNRLAVDLASGTDIA